MKIEIGRRVTVPRHMVGMGCLAAAALGGGCGNLTAGGATGDLIVYVAGDAPDPAPAGASHAWAGAGSPAPARVSGSEDEPEGELEVEFRILLVTDEAEAIPLTDDEARVRVEFPGEQRTEVVTRTVAARRYAALRVIFTDIEAEVDAGLVIDGVPVTGPIDVELEGDALVVERAIDLDLREDARAELLVDMNAAAWLASVDPDLRTVTGAIIANLVKVVQP